MKDFTQRLATYGEDKRNAKEQRHSQMVGHINELLLYIESRHEDLDMLIANANAAMEAGIKLTDSIYNSHDSFETGNFRANGIVHRLGFIVNVPDWKGGQKVVGLAVMGGGCNGDVSVVYKDGTAFYDRDKYYDFDKNFPSFLPLEEMDENLLNHYAYAAETFVGNINPFIECYERYLENVLAS